MTRLLLFILLFLYSVPAYAEWVWVSFTKSEGGYDVYADPDTIRRKGELVKMWVLYDFRTIQLATGLAYLSNRTQLQSNCADELERRIEVTWFSGNMANGNEVFTNSNESKWSPVAPGSVGQSLWKFACSKQ